MTLKYGARRPPPFQIETRWADDEFTYAGEYTFGHAKGVADRYLSMKDATRTKVTYVPNGRTLLSNSKQRFY